jgi:hypothetical protein
MKEGERPQEVRYARAKRRIGRIDTKTLSFFSPSLPLIH